MTKRGLLLWAVTVALLTSAMPSWAAPGTTPTGPKAGTISALLPVAKITRGSGKKAVTTDAKKGDELVWNDLVQTEKGGRARITLVDQSILSLGSQAQLRIVKHDARAQQTTLEMAYGRVRAQVASITRDGGNFELRTPTAVAGVIGTDFGVDSSSVGGDTFVCIAGAVQIANSNKSVAGNVQCQAGQTTTVQPGKPPTPPQPASPQQIQQLIADTEPAIIASISPSGVLPGSSFDANIAGSNMASVTTVAVAGSGITATLKSASANGVQIHVAIEQNAAPGPRTVTLSKKSGASSATIITILGPPSGNQASAYIQTLQELAQTGLAGLGGLVTGAQQSADQIAQTVTNANLNLKKPIDLTAFANALNQNYTQLQNALQTQNAAVQTASQNAVTEFQTSYNAAEAALAQRNPGGAPDSTFQSAIATAFQQANTTLQTAINTAQTTLNASLQTYGTSIEQLQQDWFTNINTAAAAQLGGPTPKVNALERDVEVGATASFDASGSSGINGATIASTTWVLCGPSYQPGGFGTPLDPSTPACNAMQGFASTQAEFDIPTCSLNPGTYFARLTLTDSGGKVTPMDVKVVVATPSYGTPGQTVQGLASAYSGLQYSPFAAFFDQSAPGIATYLNNVQTTLRTLNSMNIHIISSQDTVTCNDAVTRANWQQNYTFTNSPNTLLGTSEQLTVTMHRTPGTGWLITSMVGDNGTVQGTIPGPLITNTALPDLVVVSASISGQQIQAISGTPVAPGQHMVSAVIGNVGTADLTSNMPVVLSVLDASKNVISTTTVNLPIPVPQGSSGTVTANLTFPAGADGTALSFLVNVNPGCALPEKACDGFNQTGYPLVIQNNSITFANVTSGVTVSPGGTPGTISMDVTSSFYPVQVCSSLLNGVDVTASNPGIKPAATGLSQTCKSLSAAGTVTFSVAAATTAPAGLQNDVFTATNSGNSTSGVAGVSATVVVPVTVAIPDLQIGSLTFPAAFQVGSSGPTTIPITNTGNGPAGTGWNVLVTINGVQAGSAVSQQGIPAGQTINVPITITVPTGTAASAPVVVSVNSNGAIIESSTSNNTLNATTALVDFALAPIPTGPQTGVVGRSFSLTAVALSPSNYPLPLTVNYASLPAGLVGTNFLIAGTPTAAGSNTVTFSGTSAGVTHAGSGSILINVQPEITLVQSTVPSLVAGDSSQNLTLAVSGGIYPVTLAITLPTGITTSAGTIVGNVSTQTLTGPGNVTWDLKADFTAATGGSLTVPIHATDGGFAATGTAAGSVNLSASYAVNANANYVITSASFAGHTAPYTGANALQFGESTQLVLTIANQGNGSPTGTVTVTANCNGPSCNAVSGTTQAPAVGTPVPLTITLNSIDQPVGSYIGTATITTNVSGATTGPAVTLSFDVVDFTLTAANAITPAQNLPIGGTGSICVTVDEQLASGSAFPVSITPTAASGVTFTPSTQSASGNCIPFTVNLAQSVSPTASMTMPDLIAVTATNHGVTKTLPNPANPATSGLPVNYYNAQLTPLNLFVNDAANPLTVPVATTVGPPSNYPMLSLKMSGNYNGGIAPLTVVNPTTCGGFTDSPTPVSAQPGDIIAWPIYANVGNNCPPTSQIVIQAAIPNTNPPTNQTVYTLYVAPKGLAQLKVMSASPARDLTVSSQAWLAGEPMQWIVTVKNIGSGNSVGNEQVMLTLNGTQVGSGTLGAPIAPNGTAQVTISTDAPDFPSSFTGVTQYTIAAHVVLDTQGDLAPGSGDYSAQIYVANWGIALSGAGSSDSQPVTLTVGSGSATANVIASPPAGVSISSGVMLPLVVGSYSSSQLNSPALSPAMVTGTAGSTVTLSIQNGQSPLTGYYFAQVIAQMKDGGTVTAQRQATIHVYITNVGTTPATINLASDQNNISSCPNGSSGGCGTPPNTLQINGPLPDAVTLTATVSFCSAGPCTGNVDISLTDSFLTTTTPPVGTVGVTSPGNTLPIRVKAATNPDGSINTGAATVYASVTGIQAPFASSRQANPEPVGNNQFALAFNVGDINVTSSACVPIQPGNTTATPLSLSWTVMSGFNVPSISWEWEDSNHLPVGGSPVAFSSMNGTSTYSSGSYTSLPVFNLTNVSTTGVDGLQTYYFAITVSNGLATATKYFPFTFDLSQSQTFCPALGSSRGLHAGQMIRGSWGRGGLIASSRSSLKSSGKLPDLRINASDVSFTPSMPKTGDMVSVRFRVSNVGDVNATAVPIGLQVNGAIVVSDTFDVPVGKTVMGALNWNNAQIPAASAAGSRMTARISRPTRGGVPAPATGPAPVLDTLKAAVVIDPRQTITQKTTIAKFAPLGHFSLHSGTAESIAAASGGSRQRLVLEMGDGGCIGIRFAGGPSGCGGADVSVSVEDLAKGVYTLQADIGIADLGFADMRGLSANNAATSFGLQAVGQSGHTYAVQLRGGNIGYLTLKAVRNPNQLSAAAQKIFRGGPGGKVITALGKSSAAPEPALDESAKVYFDIMYQGQ